MKIKFLTVICFMATLFMSLGLVIQGEASVYAQGQAAIVSEEFDSLQDAISQAESGSVVRLISDVTLQSGRITISKDLTLDLGGFTLSGRITADHGNVILQNGNINGRVDCYDDADLTIMDNTVISNSQDCAVVVWSDESKCACLHVYGKIYSTNGNSAISGNGTDKGASVINVYKGAEIISDDIALYQPQNCETTVFGGKIEGKTALYVKCGKITVKGGNIIGTGEKTEYAFNGNGAIATGEAMVIDNCNYPQGVATVLVENGSFKSYNSNCIGSYVGNGETQIITDFISGGEFSSIKDVLLYIKENANIKISENITEDRLFVEKSGTFDLNGNKLTSRVTVNHGTVNLKNGEICGRVDAYGDCVLNVRSDMTIKNEGYGIVLWSEEGKEATVNLYGKVIVTGDYFAICGNGTDRGKTYLNVYNLAEIRSEDIAVYQPQNCETTVYGGTIVGATAIYVKCGSLTVKNGTIKGNGEKVEYAYNSNGAVATGDALVIDNCNYPQGIASISVQGGTFKSERANAVGSYAGNGETQVIKGFINGGSFSDKLNLELIPEGYHTVYNEQIGVYELKEHNYKNGKCTVCGQKDQNYIAPKKNKRVLIISAIVYIGVVILIVSVFISYRALSKNKVE